MNLPARGSLLDDPSGATLFPERSTGGTLFADLANENGHALCG
jgi:hypothetical protein